MAEALINSELLTWARSRARMDVAQLAGATKASLDQVRSWEAGESRPSLSKAMEVAKALRIPFGYLFLSRPPSHEPAIPDFRTVADKQKNRLSIDFHDVLQGALLKQQWFREYRAREGEKGFGFVLGEARGDSNEHITAFIREAMEWTDETRRANSGAGKYLTELVGKAETLGILVMRSGVVGSNNNRKLAVSDFRGFALADDVAPVIFINSNDAKTAQVFTFAHEVAHVWFGRSGVSDPEGIALTGKGPSVELRCNAIAASLVAPEEQMRDVWRSKSNVGAVAAHFRVSELVILRRAYDLQLIDLHELSERTQNIPHRTAKKGQGGNFHTTLTARNSPLFTRTLLADVKKGATGYRDAARLLSIRPGTIQKLEKSRSSR
jgi:Zn-dependent peptidase ImmA (M78 family)/DNA-binding XRE family transcriptional regulator